MKEKRKKVIVYAEDLESIPEQSENFFRNADIIIIDAAIYNLEREDGKLTATKRGIRGHLNTSSALQIIKKYKPDLAFLTQLGHTYPDYEETVNNVREYWYSIRDDCNTEVHIPHDGLKINLDSELINLSETSIELIEDVKNYNPSNLRNDVLRDDFRIVSAWYSSKKQGKKIKFSYEDIINLARLIYDEIERRKAEGRMKHDWHPETMKKYAKELYDIVSEKGFRKLKPAFGSPGGKLYLRDKIIPLIPEHKVYVEPYAGGASVFFGKKPSSVEVLNDLDSDVAFLYRFMKSASDEDINDLLRKDWNPNEQRWSRFKEELSTKLKDSERFYRLYYVKKWSFNRAEKTFSAHTGGNSEPPSPLKHFDIYRDRLKNVKVRNEDAIEIIKKYDSADSFFYLDPPYPEEWNTDFGYTWDDFRELIDALKDIKGKFILSINMSDKVRELLPSGWHKVKVKRLTTAPAHRQKAVYEYEYLILNYEPREYNIYTFRHSAELKTEDRELITEDRKLATEDREIPEHQKDKLSKLDLSMFKDFIIVKDFVSVVGSSVDEQSKEPADLDLLIRLNPEYSYIRRVVEAKLRKMNPEVHPFCEPMGSGDDYLPLYDLVLVRRRNPELVKLSEDVESKNEEASKETLKTSKDCNPLKPFLPMKPLKRFYRVEDAIEAAQELDLEGKGIILEKKFNGYRGLLHRKGKEVKLYSDQAKDISFPFPRIREQALKLTNRDFILDGEIVIYDEKGMPAGRRPAQKYIGAVKSHKDISDKNVVFHAFDVLYFDDKCVMELREYERKKILMEQFKETDNIKKVRVYVAKNREQAIKLIEKLKDLPGSEGAILKSFDGIYTPGEESKYWIKFRKEIELHLLTYGMLPVKGTDAVRHKLGIYITDREAELIDKKHLTQLNGRWVLTLGNSFNTSIKAEKGSVLHVQVEEIWRHLNTRTKKYHFSLHKPRVVEVLDKKSTTTLAELDNYVVSRGVQVKFNEQMTETELAEIKVRDFPKRMQESFRAVMDKRLWCPFVVQYHYRGHQITLEEREELRLPQRYKYYLRSLHQDLRLWSPVGVLNKVKPESVVEWDSDLIKDSFLEGITVLSPTTTARDDTDDFRKCVAAKQGKVRCVLKLIEPSSWLRIEGISDIGEPGSTPYAPGIFLIVAKGYYTVHEVTDHIIRIQFKCMKGKVNREVLDRADKMGIYIETYPDKPPDKLKDLDGLWNFQIAHIEADRRIILARLLKPDKYIRQMASMLKILKKKIELSVEEMEKIIELTDKGAWRSQVASQLSRSKSTILRFQKLFGLL